MGDFGTIVRSVDGEHWTAQVPVLFHVLSAWISEPYLPIELHTDDELISEQLTQPRNVFCDHGRQTAKVLSVIEHRLSLHKSRAPVAEHFLHVRRTRIYRDDENDVCEVISNDR